MLRLEERLRMTGTNMEVVAELEAMVEMAEVIKQRKRRMTTGGKTERAASWEPAEDNHQTSMINTTLDTGQLLFCI